MSTLPGKCVPAPPLTPKKKYKENTLDVDNINRVAKLPTSQASNNTRTDRNGFTASV